MKNVLMQNYKRLPVAFVRGDGAWLWDNEGNAYLDAVTGIAVCGLGHAHPSVSRALCEQAATLIHTSNLYHIPLQQSLAQRLVALSGMENAFFCNSGAEANEAAIKLARLYGHQRGIDAPAIIVTEQSFHGRTLGALAATGNYKIQTGFAPLLQGFVRVPYNDIDALRAINQANIVAVLVEPLQGEGGVRIPTSGYLSAVRTLCDERGWLLMLDEVQTGIGRTGTWFGFQHEQHMMPDVLCLAKGLGNGVPIGALLARGNAAHCFQPGTHGSTFGGNPLACRAALAVLDTLAQDNLIARVATLGQRLALGFQQQLTGLQGVVDIRHQGLLLGIELDRPCTELTERALAYGLLINVTAERVVRLLPPFILSDNEADELISRLSALLHDFLA
jgi:acetylornithine/N-succinyldiaminopimelate aminotransferase